MLTISFETDRKKMDVDFIHAFLTSSYWATGRTKAEVQKSIDHSINFGIFKDGEQIGFARVVTDYIIFAYLMDVFIINEERGNGYGVRLIEQVMNHAPFKDIKNWGLGTRDADTLYEKFGFKKFDGSYIAMNLKR